MPGGRFAFLSGVLLDGSTAQAALADPPAALSEPRLGCACHLYSDPERMRSVLQLFPYPLQGSHSWGAPLCGGFVARGQPLVPFPITPPSLTAADSSSPTHLYFVVHGEFLKSSFTEDSCIPHSSGCSVSFPGGDLERFQNYAGLSNSFLPQRPP